MPRWFICLFLVGCCVLWAYIPGATATDVQNTTVKSDSAVTQNQDNAQADAAEQDIKQADEESADTPAEKSQESSTDETTTEEQTVEKKDSKKEAEKPSPHKVERKPLKIEVELDGQFVADDTTEVTLRPEVWTRFRVLEAVEHGTAVKKGDVLVRFDDEKIEEELAEESINQRIDELELMQNEEEFPRAEKLLELNFEQAKVQYEQLVEDYEYYKNIDRPFMVRITNHRFESAKEDLDSQREELEQLQKMYEADDLTEETEEIVLRRQEFQVRTAELIMELQTESRDYTLNVQLPRNDEDYARRLEESKLKFEQIKTAKEMGLPLGKFELEKKRETRARSVERHAKLLSDRALMELRAPTDGVVYYGRCLKGKWSEVSSLSSKLRPYGTVSANTVIMTIVQQRPLHVETQLLEKHVPDFSAGLEAIVTPGADKDLELPASVTDIHNVPDSTGKFRTHLDVDLADAPDWLVAGMTCEVAVAVYENESAIVIPSEYVQTDEDDEKIKTVLLVDPEQDEPVRRKVKLGRRKGKLVEVLKGLDEGDEIVQEDKDSAKKD